MKTLVALLFGSITYQGNNTFMYPYADWYV